MLIQALCEYYDQLARDGKIVPEGYSFQNVHYLICLSPDGRVDDILDWQLTVETETKNGKTKPKAIPRSIVLPLRTEKSGIESNIIEHRPLYIFGLNLDDNAFTPDDRTDKARKSHDAFRNANLAFTEGMDSPIVNAYRNFLLNWNPDAETENVCLKALGKAYKSAYFAFCLSGAPDVLLHEDAQVNARWKDNLANAAPAPDATIAQCAVSGKEQPIARIHNKIKGIAGGQPSGTVLVGFKTSAGWSYGNEQSFNSNISETVMNKYTFALNTLLADRAHRNLIDDVTVIAWATGGQRNDACVDLFNSVFYGSNDKLDEAQTDDVLHDLLQSARDGRVSFDNIPALSEIDDNVDFYLVGLKPNASRVALKFIYHRRFGDFISAVAMHQRDMQIGTTVHTVPLWRLKNELKSPKSTAEIVDSSLLTAIFRAAIYGTEYPVYLLSALIMRIKTDKSINSVRAGAVKACINRKARLSGQKEELQLALDKNNNNQAYLCGRLFAVLQHLQEESAKPAKLNRTIKDAYFASAASKPALVFPKLLALSQNHIKKLNEKGTVYFNKLTEEIISGINGQFPDMLNLADQGRFMIGYYQQDRDFYVKSDNNTEEVQNND